MPASADGGAQDLAASPSQPLLGLWRVTRTSTGGPGATFRFNSGGTFDGWEPGANPDGAPSAGGQYSFLAIGDTDMSIRGAELDILSSTGLRCSQNATFAATFTDDLSTLSLVAHIDNCTGARLYLDGEVTLLRL